MRDRDRVKERDRERRERSVKDKEERREKERRGEGKAGMKGWRQNEKCLTSMRRTAAGTCQAFEHLRK